MSLTPVRAHRRAGDEAAALPPGLGRTRGVRRRAMPPLRDPRRPAHRRAGAWGAEPAPAGLYGGATAHPRGQLSPSHAPRGEEKKKYKTINKVNKQPSGNDSCTVLHTPQPVLPTPPHRALPTAPEEERSFLLLRRAEGSPQAPPGSAGGSSARGRLRRRGQVGAADKAPIHDARRRARVHANSPPNPRRLPPSRAHLMEEPRPATIASAGGSRAPSGAAAEGRSGAAARPGTLGGSARIGREGVGVTSLRGHVTTGAPSPVRPPAGKASPPHRPLPFPRGGGSRGGARASRAGERGLRGRGDKGEVSPAAGRWETLPGAHPARPAPGVCGKGVRGSGCRVHSASGSLLATSGES